MADHYTSKDLVKRRVSLDEKGMPKWVPIFTEDMMVAKKYHTQSCACCPVEWVYVLLEGEYGDDEYSDVVWKYRNNSQEVVKKSRTARARIFRKLHEVINTRIPDSEKKYLGGYTLHLRWEHLEIESKVDKFLTDPAELADVMNETFYRLGYDNGWEPKEAA